MRLQHMISELFLRLNELEKGRIAIGTGILHTLNIGLVGTEG